ncbi:MAG: PBSX family phage terminase large subunit [Candidatus Cloacimonetes bacterium]|nr:PBSX family phage terminase large subunit [Candidatus Cloacimonadota bacterium]
MILDFQNMKSAINKKYYPHLWNTDRYFYMVGSAGSGKSHFAAQKLIYRCFTEEVGHRFLVVRKYSPDLELSAYKLTKDYIIKWGLIDFAKIRVKPMDIRFDNGNEILFRGLDDIEKIKSIENITGIWYEEATEAGYHDLMQLNLRLRPKFNLQKSARDNKTNKLFVGDYAQIICSYNPISKQNWTFKENHIPCKKSYRKKITTNIEYKGKKHKIKSWKTVLHSTYKDNVFLPLEYVAELENLISKDETFYKIYCLGEYADLKNKIYSNYTILNEFPDIAFEDTYAGLDFGFNHPQAMSRIWKIGDKRYIKTIYYLSGKTNLQFINYLNAINFDKSIPIYADSANPDKIKEIKDAGYNCKAAYKGKESVKNGIDYMKTLKVYILDTDTNHKEEYYNYKWKEDKDGNVFDEPVKFKDDLMDADRYAEYTHYIEGGKIPKMRLINY